MNREPKNILNSFTSWALFLLSREQNAKSATISKMRKIKEKENKNNLNKQTTRTKIPPNTNKKILNSALVRNLQKNS